VNITVYREYLGLFDYVICTGDLRVASRRLGGAAPIQPSKVVLARHCLDALYSVRFTVLWRSGAILGYSVINIMN